MEAGVIVLVVIAIFALFLAAQTVRIIPQARAGVVERLGRYSRTLTPGLTIVVPFVDRVRPLIDLREQVVTFQPAAASSPRTTSAVQIDTVLYFTITDAEVRRPTRSPTRCRRSSSSRSRRCATSSAA